MHLATSVVVFELEGRRHGLPLEVVDRVVRSVEITPLPKAPAIVLGVINVQGRVIPVVNIRQRFRLTEREPGPADQLIIARTPHRSVALLVDEVSGVLEFSPGEALPAEAIVPGTDCVTGVVKQRDGMVLIHDLGRFLSLDEERDLDQAMTRA